MKLRNLIHPPHDWLDHPGPARLAGVATATVAGFAAYGFTIGCWRSPLMGVYVALKLPLLIALTLGFNGALNGMMGALLGSGLGLRQSLLALLSSFALAAVMLGALAPVTLFLAWSAPSAGSLAASRGHAACLVFHTALIATAGIAANLHLHRQLTANAPTRAAALATLLAWLAGNGFLGAQLAWILRPFFGTPSLEVAFLRPDALDGNFYLSVGWALRRTFGHHAVTASAATAVLLGLVVCFHLSSKPTK